jgi:uncharacterized protein (TIGR00255 family)
MRSMTGYGRGVAQREGCRVTVELTSVNRRQAEIAVNLPRELESLEPRVREAVGSQVARGRVSVRVTLLMTDDRVGGARINHSLARAYARELRNLAKELRLSGDITLEVLMRAPGVLQPEEPTRQSEKYWPSVQLALMRALKALVLMRQREGSHLTRELRRRVRLMRSGVKRVRRFAAVVVERYRDQLRERVKQAGLELPAADDDRLAKELVYFADRSDITEELTRLESHFEQFEECVVSAEPVGRTLDFLAQEMNREVNTLGAKANDKRISREVVSLKSELEKFREQAQNVE